MVRRWLARLFRPAALGKPPLYAELSALHAPTDDIRRLRGRTLDALWGHGPGLDWGGGYATPLPDGVLVLIDRAPRCSRYCGLGFADVPDADVRFSKRFLENLYRLYCQGVRAAHFKLDGPCRSDLLLCETD